MTDFPVYRKYTNKRIYFKILSENEFEEIQFIGKKAVTYFIEAKQYPEKLRIMDMIDCKDKLWEPITLAEYSLQKDEQS